MINYVSDGRRLYEDDNHGMFSKRLAEWAVAKMEVRDKATGELKPLKPYSISEVRQALKDAGVSIPEAFEYTAFYLFNMALADYPKTLVDDIQRATFVGETINDPDSCPESVLDCFEVKMKEKGVPIYWERML